MYGYYLSRRNLVVVGAILPILLTGCGPEAEKQSPTKAGDGGAQSSGVSQSTALPSKAPAINPATATVAPAATATKQLSRVLDGDQVLKILDESKLPIKDATNYTPESDPNKLLGRPSQYVAKVSWTDSRGGEALGATIEIYSDIDGMNKRADYVENIGKNMPMVLQYVYRIEKYKAVLRLPKDLTPNQAMEYEKVFNK